MDDQVAAVLDVYHQRMQAERQWRRDAPEQQWGPTWQDTTLLAIGPDSGRLVNILAGALQAPHIVELGTSFGYSGIWLAEAARRSGGRVTTIELSQQKSDYARDMAVRAGLVDHIDFVVADALEVLDGMQDGIDFVLVDLWKDLYVPCLDRFYPKLNPGAIVVADNMHQPGGAIMRSYRDAIRAKPGITSILVPVGTGLEISRFDPQAGEA